MLQQRYFHDNQEVEFIKNNTFDQASQKEENISDESQLWFLFTYESSVFLATGLTTTRGCLLSALYSEFGSTAAIYRYSFRNQWTFLKIPSTTISFYNLIFAINGCCGVLD